MPRACDLLTEQLNVAVSPAMLRQLAAIERSEGTKPAAFARLAIAERVVSRGRGLHHAIAESRAHGIDPVAALNAAIVAKISNV